MTKFLVGMIVGACLLALAGFLFVTQGGVNMSNDAPPLPLERYLANHALAASIGSAENDKSPVPADEATLLAGAKVYQERGCIGCHGAYGQGATGLSQRIYPHIPPLLPPAEGVTDDPVGATHWVVKHGIRFSGMPSFGKKLTDTELWQVSQMLRNANELPPSVQDSLRGKPK